MTRLTTSLASLLVLLATTPLTDCAARGYSGITNIVPVNTREGAVMFPRFAPDGRQGMVIEARLPGARTPSLMAMLPREGGWQSGGTTTDGWDFVAMPDPQTGAMSSTFNPRNGAAIFARAKVRGIPETLLLAAVPDANDPQPLAQPRRMVLLAYRLDTGAASAAFIALDSSTSSRRYCRPADALSDQFGIGAPANGSGLCTGS